MTTVSPGPGKASDDSPQLLERAAEVGELLSLLDRATQGRGGLLAFEGAAGIGKSRLLTAGIAAARERGMTVTRARGGSLKERSSVGAGLHGGLLGLGSGGSTAFILTTRRRWDHST